MKKNNRLIQFEKDQQGLINQYLKHTLPDYIDQANLADAMIYSVMAGGKRLRPMLTLAVLDLYHILVDESHLRATTALELLHTYSLIHDDLPAMDDDNLRRGRPTNHVKFGAGMATLAGDGLLTLAFQWLTDNQLNSRVQAQLTLALAKAAGPSGMVAGQADDIHFENQQLDILRLKRLHRHKTGDLIHYAVQAGLIMACQDSPQLLKFADAFGLAFQIYDDILDVVGNADDLGKPVHQDQAKNTYPNLIGLDRSYEILEKVIQSGQDELTQFEELTGMDAALLRSFFTYFEF